MKKTTKRSKTAKKSDRLPKCWSHQRKILNQLLLESQGYKKTIEKGLPFFSSEELDGLLRKYERGITWNEIDIELSKKGMIFKKATFRKYIQERKIPQARGYRRTDKGREAIYPGNMLEHINFIQYFYRIADNELIDELLSLFAKEQISAKDAIEAQLGDGNLLNGVLTYLRGMSFDDDDIHQAICDVFDDDSEFQEKALAGLSEIYDTFQHKFNEWAKMLEECKIPVSIKK